MSDPQLMVKMPAGTAFCDVPSLARCPSSQVAVKQTNEVNSEKALTVSGAVC